MAVSMPDAQALATALLEADRAVVLTGLRLGGPESLDLTYAHGRWEDRASLEAFLTEPARFWEYLYPTALEIAAREPTAAHRALARLQAAGVVGALITQAVDRLHARAGSTDVVEVYGTLLVQRCGRCDERYGLPEAGALRAQSPDGVPRCTTPGCGYPLRPEGTLWGEPLPSAAVERAWELAAEADTFIVLDSDLRTAPISLLPSVPLTRGVPLVMVGEVPTQYDRYARMVVRESSAELLVAAADLIAPG
ncbi:MAG: NAD-dependent deacetylase [Thermoleophilia bacterium]